MNLNKILLVDDDKVLNFLNRKILKDNKVHCEVAEALNGQQALDYLDKSDECPDVILLDINMPQLDGFQFLTEFAKLSNPCTRTKIFMLTSSLRDEDKNAALANRLVTGYFDKPLSTMHIERMLDEFKS